MGILDFFSDILDSIVESPQKPGQLCDPSCNINDIRCKDCLAEQQKILDAIDEAQNLEKAVKKLNNDPGAAAGNKITNCPQCGASFEKGMKSCPYCDTPYPPDALLGDLPADKIEQDKLLLDKAAAISALYSAFYRRRYQESHGSRKAALPSFLGGAVDLFHDIASDKMEMNKIEIKKYAEENNVSYCGYVIGVIKGTYKSSNQTLWEDQAEVWSNAMIDYSKRVSEENDRRAQKMEEYRKEMEAERQKRQERYERQEQQRLKAQEERRKIQQERHERELMMAKMRAPHYVAGGGSSGGAGSYCCGNCKHYMAGANECAIHSWTPKSASDYCNDHRSR